MKLVVEWVPGTPIFIDTIKTVSTPGQVYGQQKPDAKMDKMAKNPTWETTSFEHLGETNTLIRFSSISAMLREIPWVWRVGSFAPLSWVNEAWSLLRWFSLDHVRKTVYESKLGFWLAQVPQSLEGVFTRYRSGTCIFFPEFAVPNSHGLPTNSGRFPRKKCVIPPGVHGRN